MTRYDSDRINDLLAAGSRDLTPASARHAAYVLYAPVSRDPEVSSRCASVLSDTDRCFRSDSGPEPVGVVKAGGQITPIDAPGMKANLKSASVEYKILGDKETAVIKVWGFD